MRRIVALFLAVLTGAIGLTLAASPASAATITSPSANPFLVPGDAAGNPVAFTVTASGFTAGTNVFIEQCDGTPPTTLGWSPTANCDLVSSPAASIADAGGNVTFLASDINHGFTPFKGNSPQGIFNCLAPGQASPGNGLPDFTNCQIRVSSNNTAVTGDQTFLTMTLPAAAAGVAPNFAGTPGGGTVGTPYSFAFTGITGSPAPTFTLSPTPVSGLTLSAAGVLSGTPSTAGSFPITVTASNGVAPAAVKTFTLVIAPAGVAPNFAGTPGSGTVGTPYSFAFTGITGSPAPTFALSPTPVSGLTISSAGVISGTPSTAGSFPITVTASNGVAPAAVKPFTLVIAPANTDVPPNFTGTPGGGTVGTPYSFAFTGITGSPAPTFALSPTPVSGLTISSAGVISGTPSTAGSFPITVTASNGVAPDAVKTFTLVIAPANTDVPPNFTGTPGGGTVGTPYSFAFTGITGSPAPTFALSPTPVSGLTLSAAGVLSGTPSTAGSFPITVTASNGVAPDAVKTFTLVIAPANTDVPPNFTGTPGGGTVGTPYSFAFTGITGSPAPTFALSPTPVSGLTLSAAGVLSGTPSTAGSFPITVTASNGVAPDAVKTFTLVIAPANTDVPPNLTGTPGSGTVGKAYTFAFTGITGSPAPTFTLDPTSVAGGITISPDGVLSGTPTTAGSFTVTVTASNGVAPDAVKSFTLVIAPTSNNQPRKLLCLVAFRHHNHKHLVWKVLDQRVGSWHGGRVLLCFPLHHKHHGWWHGGWSWHHKWSWHHSKSWHH